MDGNIFLQISALLGITVSIAFVMRLLKQPLMIAYIIAGIVAGPLFLDFLHGSGQTFDTLAQFGVVLLLFLVGLDLNINKMKDIGKVSIVAGLAQVLFTASIGFFILKSLAFSTTASAYLALALTFSSTIIIVKLLSDKKDTNSVYGRYVFGLMIVQDIIAILIMMFLTSLNGDADPAQFYTGLAVRTLALITFIYVMARYIIPRLLDKVAKSSEFLFIFTIAWCFGLASLLHWAGFSLEIGAIVAGLTLGSSTYQPEIGSRIKPLRDFFIILFFIILGSEMSIATLGASALVGVLLSAFILFGNPFILYHTFRRFKFTRRNSFLAGVTAAQVSEFGFVLLFTGQQLGHVGSNELTIFTIVALVTIFSSSYAITYNEQLYRAMLPLFKFFGRDKYRQKEHIEEKFDVWVFGYHRLGWKICELLEQKHVKYAVVDFNPRIISRLKHRGIPAYFGDAADVEFLNTLPLEKSKMVISTLPEADDQHTLITHIRDRSVRPKIIATLYHNKHLETLYNAGANYVMMPHLLGGRWITDVLRDKAWSKRTFDTLRTEQKREMRMQFTPENKS